MQWLLVGHAVELEQHSGEQRVRLGAFAAEAARARESKEQHSCQGFSSIDKDGDGYITAEELRPYGIDARYMVSKTDSDGDGRVSPAEYCAAET